MKIHKDSRGFAVVETVLILVIVGLIGFVGWYVWRAKQSTDKAYTPASSSTSHATPNSTPKSGAKTPAPASAQPQTPSTPDYDDGNFVALGPSGGLLTNKNETTFQWAPHKLATMYEVQIRFIGQATYPTTTPSDQVVTYSDANSQPSVVSLSKNMPDGDYQWHVVAKAYVKGVLTTLQATQDRYLQIHTQ